MLQFSAEILDGNIAPGVTEFTSADIPDVSNWAPESRSWIANYFLNCLVARPAFPHHAYYHNFLRRTVYAFKEHEQARTKTLEFLGTGGDEPSTYAMALFHWETFLGQSWHAYALLSAAWKGNTKSVYKPHDGSIEQRLNALYDQMKHVESRILTAGQMLPGATVPVWLENAGLCSVDTHLSFAETAEVLKDLAKYADALMDPKTAAEKLRALDTDS